MPRIIDYYFSLVSPWAYIGHAPFMDIVERHGVEVNYKPVFLGRVFAETGGLPLAQRRRVPARLASRRTPPPLLSLGEPFGPGGFRFAVPTTSA